MTRKIEEIEKWYAQNTKEQKFTCKQIEKLKNILLKEIDQINGNMKICRKSARYTTRYLKKSLANDTYISVKDIYKKYPIRHKTTISQCSN